MPITVKNFDGKIKLEEDYPNLKVIFTMMPKFDNDEKRNKLINIAIDPWIKMSLLSKKLREEIRKELDIEDTLKALGQ